MLYVNYISIKVEEKNLQKNIIYFRTIKIKYLAIYLTRYVQDLYEENYITDERNEGKQINEKMFHIQGQEDNILGWEFFSTWYIDSVQPNYFGDIDKIILNNSKKILKFIRKVKNPRVANTIEKSKFGGLTLPNLKTYYKALMIKKIWCKEIIDNQINRIKSPEIDSYKYSH